jgi:hypothetical protein
LYGGSGGAAGSAAGGVTSGAASAPVEFSIRSFTLAERAVQTIRPDEPWLVPITNLALLPLNYFLELGFFSIVGVVVFRQFRRAGFLHLSNLGAFAIAMTSVLICTFLRSSVIANNDLGWRGFLPAQFFMLIWAAELWDDGYFAAHSKKAVVAALVALGVAGTVYEITMVRFYTLVSDEYAIGRDTWFPADHRLGDRTYSLRGLYEQLQERLPADAVVQHNPNQPVGDVFHGLYADRQLAAETPGCGVVFGGDAHRCSEVMPSITAIFDGHEAGDWRRVEAACRELSIAALVVKDTDVVWKDQHSWVWTRPPLVANQRARAVLCGSDVSRATE